jgi:hypothetical protein
MVDQASKVMIWSDFGYVINTLNDTDRFTGSTRSRSSGMNYGNHTSSPCSFTGSVDGALRYGSDAQCSAGTTTATCGGAVVLPVASALPLGRLGLGVGKLLWRRRTSCPEPMAPTPSYSAARQGPTSLLTDWASPIRTRVKGPMGRWAHWWRDQSNILPLDLTIYLLTSFLIPLQISV